jgi:hypothetical protein
MAPLSLEIDQRFKATLESQEPVPFKELISRFSAYIDYGMNFDMLRGRFVARGPVETPNLSHTLGTLTRAGVLRFLPDSLVPPDIPHYLSDYYLTYSLTQMGFQLAIDPAYFVVRFDNVAHAVLATDRAVARRESLDPRSRLYLPALLRFREDFSKEPRKQIKMLIKKVSYQTHMLLNRAS